MKRSKLLLVLVLALVAVMALVACDKTPVHEHAYGGWTIETAPTASAEGTATRKCACGEKETATLASLSDTSVWTVSNNVPATHTQDGCTVYTSQYGTVVVTLGKLTDHKYGAWEITVKPDLTTAGKAKRTCECGDIDEVDVPALENAVWTAATVVRASHDEEGLVRYTSVYGTVEKTVAKGEHSWSSWKIVTAPTATEKGEAARFCTTNGCKSTETAELPVLTDTTFWTASVTAATCTTPAITTYTSLYGTVTVETAPANGHNFQVSAIIAESKCTEKGSATIKCTVCGCEETKEIAALGHAFSGAFVPYIASAMENEDGETWGTDYDGSEYHAQKCSRCGVYDDANKQPHTFNGAPVYKVSESSLGYHTVNAYYTCDDCEYTKSEELTGYLEQTEYWTKGEETPADYNKEGKVIYTYKEDNTQITIVTPKLVAPYDGKTYTAADVDFKTEPDALSKCDKINAFITLDETGKGTGTAFPFKGDVSVTMVDSATGKIRFASDGNTYDGYVDMETGIIAYFGFFNKVYILSPFDSANSEYKASQFALSRAIEYTPDCNLGSKHSFTMFVTDDKVYFGVRFNNGTADISANECFEAENLVVFDKDGNKIKGFKKVDGTTTALDGYEGTYTNSADATESVVIDGIGGLVINGTVNGVYTKAADADYFEVYVVDGSGVKTAYYHVTISGNTYTKVAKNATVKFTSAEGTAPADATVFANIEYVLASMADTETKKFMGWKRAGSEEIITSVKPAIDEEINLEAVWADKVKINIVDSVGGNKTAYIGNGDMIATALPAYEIEKTVSPDNTKYFVCWYIDANSNGVFDTGEAIDAEAEITTADNGITVVANWADSCALAGTYYGVEVWGKEKVGSSVYSIVINAIGEISGKKTGKISAFDTTTGRVTWNEKNSYTGILKTTDYYFWFDPENKIIAGIYNDTNIGSDYYLLTSALTESSFKPNASYGVKNPLDKQGLSIQFVNVNTINGSKNVLLYNNTIYSNITIENANGITLAVQDIKNSTTLLVKNATTNEIIVAVATTDNNFDTSKTTQTLDEYFGTYTCEGQGNLVLDGVGNFVWGSKNGTYTLKDATAKTFDAYVVVDGKNTEYYVITLDTTAKTYVAAEQKVTVTYTSTIKPNEDISAVTVWKNVEFTLKALTNAGNMFRGWYVEGAEGTLYNGAYTATADVTLIAKWDTKFTFTAVYNDGTTANLVKEYGEGDKVNVEKPVWKKHKFDGWFTTETFVAGTEWTSGTAITANVTVYAKWSDAEAYYNTYLPIGFSKTSANGDKENADVRNYGIISINADGVGTGTGYPFRGNVKIIDFNKTAGTMVISVDGTKYNAYMDNATGLIVMSQTKEDTTFAKVWLLSPFETAATVTSSASYWNSGKTRVIEYTFDGITYKVFVHEGKVYFNVQFKSALTEGTDVAGENAYQAELLCVLDSEGNLLFKFAYDGTTMVALDGYEGKYAATNVGEVELDGVKTIKFGGNTGTYAKAEDGAGYTFDVYMTEGENTVYYRVTVEKSGMTCTVVKPMVTITYDTNGVTPVETLGASESKNMNVAYALPVLTNADKIFRGWYVSTDESKTLVSAHMPVEDVTFVAKWDDKVTATIVYGNGMENATAEFGKGDALNLSTYVPVKTNGKYFSKWYVLNGEAHADLPATIDANMTVYCEWVDTPPYTITTSSSNQFTYADGVWTSGNKGKHSTDSTFTITATTNITVTFQYFCETEGASYDYLLIRKGSQQFIKDGGLKDSKIVYSEIVTVELNAGETLSFTFHKDGSVSKGLDCAMIKDLTINGTAVTEM